MTDPTAPTITYSNFKIKTGGETFTAANDSGKFKLTVPASAGLSAVTINTLASAASYMYLSDAAGTKPVAEIGTAAADLTGTFSVLGGMTFYIADKTDATLDSTTHAIGESTTLISTYVVEIDASLDVVKRYDSYTLGLGAATVYGFSKFRYTTGGIAIDKTTFGIISLSLKGSYTWYFDKINGKIMIFSSGTTEVDAGTQIDMTVFAIRQ